MTGDRHLWNGGHAHRIGADDPQEPDVGRRFEGRARQPRIDPFLQGQIVLLRHLAGKAA